MANAPVGGSNVDLVVRLSADGEFMPEAGQPAGEGGACLTINLALQRAFRSVVEAA